MLVAIIESAHPPIEFRKLCFGMRVGSIDENTIVRIELDQDNNARLVLLNYEECSWTESKNVTEIILGETGMEIVHPMGFCLNRKQRDRLKDIFVEQQYYGMTGWEFVQEFIKNTCTDRNIPVPYFKEPDFDAIPILEDGARGLYDRWFFGSERNCDLHTMLNIPLGNNTFAFAFSNHDMKPEKIYFKVYEFVEPLISRKISLRDCDIVEYDTEEPYDEIRRWCRISLERPEYITGFDECMVLTKEQRENFIKAVREKWDEIVEDYNSFVSHNNDKIEDLTRDYNIPDYSLLPVEEVV